MQTETLEFKGSKNKDLYIDIRGEYSKGAPAVRYSRFSETGHAPEADEFRIYKIFFEGKDITDLVYFFQDLSPGIIENLEEKILQNL